MTVVLIYLYKVKAGANETPSNPEDNKTTANKEAEENKSPITRRPFRKAQPSKPPFGTPNPKAEDKTDPPSSPSTDIENRNSGATGGQGSINNTQDPGNTETQPPNPLDVQIIKNDGAIWDQDPGTGDNNNDTGTQAEPSTTGTAEIAGAQLEFVTYTLAEDTPLWTATLRCTQDGTQWNDLGKANKDIVGDTYDQDTIVPKGSVIKVPRALLTSQDATDDDAGTAGTDDNTDMADNAKLNDTSYLFTKQDDNPQDDNTNKNKTPEEDKTPLPSTIETFTEQTYTIKEFDKLWNIAETYYGNGTAYIKILEVNPGLDPDRLQINSTIKLPVIPGKGPKNISADPIRAE